jgi:23S rRNA (guanosine2251-2'-O)-methyltransferase
MKNQTRNQERNDKKTSEREDLIYGRNPILEALNSSKEIDTIYLSGRGGTLSKIFAMAKEKKILVKTVTDAKLSEMTGTSSHQGVCAVISAASYVSLEELIAVSKKKGTPAFLIMCDEIEDPHNLGAIIRTAECTGADGVIIPKRRSASLNGTVFKTSAGAANYLPVARVTNLSDAIETLKENGIWIYGTDASGELYTKTDLTGNICLVIGSEGKGIGRKIAEKCDFMLRLPMSGKINSLNASVAAAVFMYETVRQRQS